MGQLASLRSREILEILGVFLLYILVTFDTWLARAARKEGFSLLDSSHDVVEEQRELDLILLLGGI